MSPSDTRQFVLRTLLYYDIFEHALTQGELFALFPRTAMSEERFGEELALLVRRGEIACCEGLYQMPERPPGFALLRRQKMALARRRLRTARLMARIMKRFPFVRGVFVSGDLSKGVARPSSDIDYVIITAPHRLWICRTLLILFKKTVLLNSRKYFCLNSFVAEDGMTEEARNYYTATEIAHLKPVFGMGVFLRYMNANGWIKELFPNFRVFALAGNEADSRRSVLQRVAELAFSGAWADRLDRRLMEWMRSVWKRRYPQYDGAARRRLFRCTPTASSAYPGDFAEKILTLYSARLAGYRLTAEYDD